MEIIKKIKNKLPVSKKLFEEMNEHYATVIDGLVLAIEQQEQLTSAALRKMNEMKCNCKNTKKSTISGPKEGYQ